MIVLPTADCLLLPGSKRGVTLIELVLAMLVLGLALPALLNLLSFLIKPNVQAEHITQAASLGHALLEEVLSKRFHETLATDFVGTAEPTPALGVDTGEAQSDRTTLDDVDDFHGLSEAGPLAGYTQSVDVAYDRRSLYTSGVGTDYYDYGYKKVTVTVRGPAGTEVSLLGLATQANSQGDPGDTVNP